MEHIVATHLSQICIQDMPWKDWKQYQFLGLMRSGTKADMVTCTDGNTTAVEQDNIVVHSVTHTSAYMKPHIPNIQIIDAVMDIYSGNYSKSAHIFTTIE